MNIEIFAALLSISTCVFIYIFWFYEKSNNEKLEFENYRLQEEVKRLEAELHEERRNLAECKTILIARFNSLEDLEYYKILIQSKIDDLGSKSNNLNV